MSNYLSQEYKIQAPTSNVDVNLVGRTLQTMQGAYDVNKSIIDQTLSAYNTKLRGLRDSDNQYIQAKLSEVTSAINEFSKKNGNLAYSYNKDAILKAATSVLDDPIVQDAVTSAQNAANYDAQYQALIKKDPKQANSINYEYGKYIGGYQDYMQGKTKKLGQLQYNSYVNLNEENLKKLKTIKDIKGKRFVEIQDPNNPGQLVRKEIDGLEDWEINQYLGSTFTAPELQQLKINSWAKFGANDIEANRLSVVRQYDEYRTQRVEYLTNEKIANESVISDSSMPDDKRETARRKVNDLTESIADLKAFDPTTIDTTTLAASLEKTNYLNGISQLAKAEWSTEFKKNDVYFENQKLDLDIQKFGLETKKFELDQFKAYQEAGKDAQGNLIGSGVVSQTPMSAELAEKLTVEGTGQATLKEEHDAAYRSVMDEAKNFLNIGIEENVNTLKAQLNKRGIEVVNGNYKFKDETKNASESLANTVYAAFKDSGNLTPEMYKSNEVKRQKASELLTVKKEGYSKVFNVNPDAYVRALRITMEGAANDANIFLNPTNIVSRVFQNVGVKSLDQYGKIKSFVDKNGGWGGLKETLQANPLKLAEFAELSGTVALNTPSYKTGLNLKRDAKEEIEKTIQEKTQSGVMMSAYNQFNLLNDKVKETVLKSVVSDEVVGGSDFDPKQNVTIRKRGDDVYIEQRKTTGTGKNEDTKDLAYKVNKASSLYGELSKYIELGSAKNQNYIQATKDVKIDPMKVDLPSYATSTTGQQTTVYRVETTMPLEAKGMFGVVNGQPGRLATKELASQEITSRLLSFGVPKDKVDRYRSKVLGNLNAYIIKTVVKPNPAANFKNEFAIEIVDNNGKRISDGFLGTDKLSYDMKYSMEMYPQVYVLNQLLHSASVNRNNIDEEIKKL